MGGILHRRGGFTLIELLVVVMIIGVMLGGALLSVGSGSASAQMKSATRRVLQLSRHARTVALLRQQPAVITYEEVYDGQTLVGGRVTIEAKAVASAPPSRAGAGVLTLYGEPPGGEEALEEPAAEPAVPVSENEAISKEQELMEKIVDDPRDFTPDKTDATDWDPDAPRSFRGIHMRVELLDEESDGYGARKSSISVFSNVDFLRRRARDSAAARTARATGETEVSSGEDGEKTLEVQEPVSVVYETNGRCQPHRIKIWKDGADEDSGLTVLVDRFGKTTVEDNR